MSETWGFLASPPRDVVRVQRWLRAKQVRKIRQQIKDRQDIAWWINQGDIAREAREAKAIALKKSKQYMGYPGYFG